MCYKTIEHVSVKVCEDLIISSSNVSQSGRTYGDVVHGTCNSGWETAAEGATDFSVTCDEFGQWNPTPSCQSK